MSPARALLALCCPLFASAASAAVVSMVVYDSGNFNLDGNVGASTAPNPTFPIQTPGAISQLPLWGVNKFDRSVILDPSVTAADIVSATLRIPDYDRRRNGDPNLYPFTLEHFATTDNTTIVAADG